MTSQTPEERPNIEEVEALSEKIHHLYCAQYEKDNGEPYWTKGDYSKLDERTKEYDRNIARFIHHQLQKAREERDTYWKKRVGEIRLLIANYAREEDLDVAGLVNEINTLCK